MKKISNNKIYKDIKDTFNLMKLPLGTKFSKDTKKEIQLIIKGIDNKSIKRQKSDNNEKNLDEPQKIINNNIENIVEKNRNVINSEFEKEQNTIENNINKYLNSLNNIQITNSHKSASSSPSSHKKNLSFNLPTIKLIHYKQNQPPKKKIITEDDKKPDIRKLLPYSKLGKNNDYRNKNDKSYLNENNNKNFPFITEPNIKILRNNTNYNNTLNVVYNSANNEFLLQNKLDKKRSKLEKMLGIDEIPQLNIYDDIAFKNSEKIKEKRHQQAKSICESQKFAVLSRKAKINMIIDNDMKLLDKLENKIYNNEKNLYD